MAVIVREAVVRKRKRRRKRGHTHRFRGKFKGQQFRGKAVRKNMGRNKKYFL